MKRLCVSAVIVMCAMLSASVARAQDATPEEKEKALKYLEQTRKNIEEATKGLSEAQWNFKPGPDRWSVAQVMEHIAAAEDFLRDGLIVNQVMKQPAAPDRDVAKIDDGIKTHIPDRSQKAQAPEPLVPTNRFGSPEGSLKHFEESRVKTEDFLTNTTDLRAHAMDSPLGQKLDAYDWILFLTAHSERHTKQILEVKADPNFPKS
jgi:hypothetical protein